MSELARALYRKSQKLIDESEYEKAIVYLLNAIEDDQYFLEGYVDLAYCYAMLDDFGEAEYYCDKALEISPNDINTLLMLAFVYHKFELYDDEIEILNRVLNLGVHSEVEIDVFLNLGNAYYEKGDMGFAIAYYKKVIVLDPDSIEAYVNLGNAYFANEEFDNSIEAYRIALQLDPEDSNIYSNLGVAYIELGNGDRAFRYLREAIKLDPYNESAHYNLGILYAMSNEENKALEQYKKLLELNSDMAPALLKILDLKDKFLSDRSL